MEIQPDDIPACNFQISENSISVYLWEQFAVVYLASQSRVRFY